MVSSAIAILHRSVFANAEVRNNLWHQIKGRQLSNCTVGIIGCGNIGKDLVKLLKPLNCKILSHDILSFPKFYQENNVLPVSLEELLKISAMEMDHEKYEDYRCCCKRQCLVIAGSMFIGISIFSIIIFIAL